MVLINLSTYILQMSFKSKRSRKGATIFCGIGGHEFPKVPRQYFCDPPIWWSKIWWHPFWATMLKKHVTPNAPRAENMHFLGYFIEQNFH